MKFEECSLLDKDAIENEIDSNQQQIKPESDVSKNPAKTNKLITSFSDFLRIPDTQLFDEMKAHQNAKKYGESHIQTKIQRVQEVLRRNEDFKHYYEPMEISFGPLHAADSALFKAELKLELAAGFTKGTGHTIENVFGEIKKNLPELKKCFHEKDIEFYTDEMLARLLFLDGCATLQFIESYTNQTLNNFNIHNSQSELIRQDLFLLENQIPFQVLRLLMDMKDKKRAPEKEESDSMKDNLIQFVLQNNIMENIESMENIPRKQISDLIISEENRPVHLLDLLRSVLVFDTHVKKKHTEIDDCSGCVCCLCCYFWLCTSLNCFDGPDDVVCGGCEWCSLCCEPCCVWCSPCCEWCLWCCACLSLLPFIILFAPFWIVYLLFASSDAKYFWNQQHSFRNVQELKAAGISMKASKSWSLKEISFHGGWFLRGYVKLPPLLVDGSTKRKMLNLVAYEMSTPNYQEDCYVMSYIQLLDLLIDNEDDVKDLRSKDLLRNHLSSDKEVSDLIDKIGKTCFAPPKEKYHKVKVKIENHYKRKLAVWMAQVYHAHFSSPWTILALLGAVTILVLTAIQTWYAIHPKK